MKRLLLSSLLLSLNMAAMADEVIMAKTANWQSVAIAVNEENHTYSIQGTVPSNTDDYYYAYSGYRCLREQEDIAGLTALIFHSTVEDGQDIYCYPN